MRSESRLTLAAVAAAACLLLLLLAPAAAAQAGQGGRVRLKAQAEEAAEAFSRGDYGRLADLTLPKLVRILGGRARLAAHVERGVREMRAQGFELIAFDIGEPGEFVRAGRQLFAVVPTTLKMKAPGGTLEQGSFILGISADGGANWTFIHTPEDRSRLGQLLPAAALRKLKLPEPQQPVFRPAP